jgi:haloacid dehalogenase superfamily, subfamily IA, variant 3 with third motif having DD or ED/haloacid dehalogenase superfamily, subfamily IA, variant 1 with third motif having Dx(3-4)D or Dx(3-4)E
LSGGVFDLDGTLASTAMAHLRAWQLALAEVGVTDVKIEIRGLLGMRAYDIAKEIVRAAGLSYDMIGKLIDLKVKHFDVIVPSLAKPMPCAVNMARALRGRGMKFVVVTSSLRRNAVRVLESIGLKPDVLVAGDDVDRGKPDPEPVLLALELAGLSPKEVFAVGDTLNDVKAYRSAGIDRVYLVKGDVEVPVDESELKGLGAHRVESLCDVMRLEGLT